MKLITVLIPERYLEALEDLIKRKYYPNRAEAIRMGVRDLLLIPYPNSEETGGVHQCPKNPAR